MALRRFVLKIGGFSQLGQVSVRTPSPRASARRPAAAPIMGRRFLDLVSGETGRPVKAGATSKTALRVIGVFSPYVRDLTETVYQFEGPFVSDAPRFGRAFGPFDPTPHPEAVTRTVAWLRSRRV